MFSRVRHHVIFIFPRHVVEQASPAHRLGSPGSGAAFDINRGRFDN